MVVVLGRCGWRNGALLVFGGYTGAQFVSDIWRFDPVSSQFGLIQVGGSHVCGYCMYVCVYVREPRVWVLYVCMYVCMCVCV